MNRWAADVLTAMHHPLPPAFRLESASDDASFRRYFRGRTSDGASFIFVDAPPELEDSEPFVRVSQLLLEAGLNAPEVIASDLEAGFMMLTDLGDCLYSQVLQAGDSNRIEYLYRRAFEALVRMQTINSPLPPYDEGRLRQEMSLFLEWFLPRQLDLDLSAGERQLIDAVMDSMVENALEQPQVFVHRDFHCRNLMVVAESSPGILDFQDAVVGPVTYDLVSALKDCYHRFDDDFVSRHLEAFRLTAVGDDTDAATFRRWFDWMGMQRHLKVAGIFSRLNLRDGKARYLADIPRVIDYILDVCDRYGEFGEFGTWLVERVVPRVRERCSR